MQPTESKLRHLLTFSSPAKTGVVNAATAKTDARNRINFDLHPQK
jgi:hypothetical protein